MQLFAWPLCDAEIFQLTNGFTASALVPELMLSSDAHSQ
jgi:hypothetical protein